MRDAWGPEGIREEMGTPGPPSGSGITCPLSLQAPRLPPPVWATLRSPGPGCPWSPLPGLSLAPPPPAPPAPGDACPCNLQPEPHAAPRQECRRHDAAHSVPRSLHWPLGADFFSQQAIFKIEMADTGKASGNGVPEPHTVRNACSFQRRQGGLTTSTS